MYGRNGNVINTTPMVWDYQYVKEMKNSGFKRKCLFQTAKIIGKICNRLKFMRKFIVFLESEILNGEIYDDYFIKYEPDLLITSSVGYMIDPFIMRSAKRKNCKVLSIVHSWDNPTTKPYRGASPDYVVAWNKIMKQELIDFQEIDKEKIYIGGIAHWDTYFDGTILNGPPYFKKHSSNSNPRKIFYATSGPIIFKTTFEVIEGILYNISNGRIPIDCRLNVRLHPAYLAKEKNQEGLIIDQYKPKIEKIKKKYSDLIEFHLPIAHWVNDDYELPIQDIKNLGELLIQSDLLLTEYSTLMIEGSIFDTPVINVALGNFRNTDQPISVIEDLNHIQRVLKTKATRQAYNMDQLIDQINQYLSNPQLDSENRKKLVEREITTNIGHAGESIGEYIYSLIE